jgi:hypothetical protein
MIVTVQYAQIVALINLVYLVALDEPFQVHVARFLSTCSHASNRRRMLKRAHRSAAGRVQPVRSAPSYEHWKYRIFKTTPSILIGH